MQGVDLQKKSKELSAKLDNYIKNNLEALIEKFVVFFSSYCDQIYQMQQKGKGEIAYIQFSVLRTNILLKRHNLRIDAYDENWYMDFKECSAIYPVEEIYIFLEEYGDVVEELRRKAEGKISLAEAQKRIFEESNIYLFYVAELIRLGMRKAIQTEAYQRVNRAPCFTVCIGGFLDRFDILYREDTTIKESKVIRRLLQSRERLVYSHEIYENLDLSKGNYEDLEFQYSSFSGCNLSKSRLDKSRILFCNFQNTILKETKMEKVKIFATDFSGATLDRVSFMGSKLKNISFDGASLFQVDFSKALLAEEITFENANLIECILPERS